MINSIAYDLEVFPNMFSGIFVDIKEYFEIFKDCVDEKGKPKPITECITVKEIKRRLDSINCKTFYITDTYDSQLLEFVAYINNMTAHYDTIIDEAGNVVQTPIRYDLYGYNSKSYDDNMIRGFMMNFNRYDSTKSLIKYLYNLSKKLIDLQNDRDAFSNDKELELLKNYKLPYASVDVMQVYGLNAASVVYDKDSGSRIKFSKGAKNTSINLKWHEVLDFTLPEIDEEEYEIYKKQERFQQQDVGKKIPMSIEQVRSLLTNSFDRYVLPKYIPKMLHYDRNDVFIVCEMVRQNPDEVRLRYSLKQAFGIDCLSSARSNISDKLLVKFYSQFSGLSSKQFEKLRTERTRISFNKVIFPHIEFKTKQLKELLEDVKKVYIYHTTKDDFTREFEFDGTKYSIGCGGIHTQDPPRILKSTDEYVYLHHDYASYYPSLMVSFGIAPKHLNKNVFIKMIDYFKTTRVKAKHTKDDVEYVIKEVPNKITAEVLKIVINAIYGKLGSDVSWLYDRLAQMQVTINGQLMTLTLIEALSLEGIKTVSANTDGIVIKLPRNKFDIYERITREWNEANKMGADYETYNMVVSRDVNCYFDIQENGEIEYKGDMDPLQYRKEYKKGYDMPIVAKAVFEYFAHNIPVMETLRNHKDILDFCKTQNVGRNFNIVYQTVVNGKIVDNYQQRHFRYYVSTKGVVLQKEDSNTGKRTKLAGGLPIILLNSLDDKSIELRNINYKYYYDECYKFINPIKLGISTKDKPNASKGVKSGKILLRKYDHDFLTLFDESE